MRNNVLLNFDYEMKKACLLMLSLCLILLWSQANDEIASDCILIYRQGVTSSHATYQTKPQKSSEDLSFLILKYIKKVNLM